jgi:hypothetical protein
LELQYCQLKRENVTTEMFWGLHKTEASLVLRAADVDTILANTTQWADVAVEISRTVHGSRLGNAMFGFAATLVASETFSGKVDDLLGMLPVNVTTNVIAEITEKALAEAGKLLCADLVASKRNITVMYRGIKLTLAVTDVSAEIELRIAAWLKSRAVHAELLEPLLGELDMIPLVGPPTLSSIAPSLLTSYGVARKSVNEVFKTEAHSSGELVKELMYSKMNLYTSFDSTFVIEYAFITELAATEGLKILQQRALRVFPDAVNARTLEFTQTEIDHLAESGLFRFVNRASQASLNGVREILGQMIFGGTPDIASMQHTTFLASVSRRLQFFCVYIETSTKDNAEKIWHGKEALKLHYANFTKKAAQGASLTFADTETLERFWWLLDDDAKEVVTVASKKMLQESIVVKKTKAPSSSAGAASSSTGPAKKKKKDDTSDLVDLFG